MYVMEYIEIPSQAISGFIEFPDSVCDCRVILHGRVKGLQHENFTTRVPKWAFAADHAFSKEVAECQTAF